MYKSTVRFDVYKTHTRVPIGKDDVGGVEDTIESFLNGGLQGGSVSRDIGDGCSLTFSIQYILKEIIPTTPFVKSLSKDGQQVLHVANQMTRIFSSFGEFDTHAKYAIGIFGGLVTVLGNQVGRDEQVQRLLEDIIRISEFLDEVNKSKLVKSTERSRVLKELTYITYECALFIYDYTERSFAKNAVKSLTADLDGPINDFKSRLQIEKDAFVLGSLLRGEQAAARIETQYDEKALGEMPYTDARYGIHSNCCLEGTRTRVLKKVEEWITNDADDSPRLCLLFGAAGKGKTAIANSIAKKYEDNRCLTSRFSFSRSDPRSNFFSTISRDIAYHHSSFRDSLLSQIQDGVGRKWKSGHIMDQLETLFAAFKGCALKPIGRVLIVIDALDEAPPQDIKAIINGLSKMLTDLPVDMRNLRIFITSRPEQIIQKAFGTPTSLVLNLDQVESLITTEEDIVTFVTARLSKHGMLTANTMTNTVRSIAQKSEGLFLFASLVCDALEDGEGKTLMQTLEDLLEATGIYGLYDKVLQRNFNFSKTNIRSNFELAVGLLMTATHPLSLDTIRKLFHFKNEVLEIVNTIFSRMGSLLTGVSSSDPTQPILPIHTSFRDYLTAQERSTEFWIDKSRAHQLFASATLACMQERLQFNMCKVQTSHRRNKDQEGLRNRVKSYFDDSLRYACLSWSKHVANCTLDHNLEGMLDGFLKKHLLFWFEAISLLGTVNTGGDQLEEVVQQIKKDDIYLFAQDALQFIRAFGRIISESVPHLYLSALAFAPNNSLVHQHFGPLYHGLHNISHSQEEWWASDKVLGWHSKSVWCIACSPDGKKVVSGSHDNTVRIWDMNTHNSILLEGHSDLVRCVAFSPDGKKVVSGSDDNTVRIWDVDTHNSILLEGHSGLVRCVAFSPDGKKMVSGSRDNTMRIWDMNTHNSILLEGHSSLVWCVAFLPDGKKVVSGSHDNTVRIWDVEKHDSVQLKGHFSFVWCVAVAISPDGKKVVSGSGDNTVRIWDVNTHNSILLEGHSNLVECVAFLPDGKKVVSGSHDNTVRIWDVEKHDSVQLKGRSSLVWCVAISPDGRKVVFGLDDNTVRIWDVEKHDSVQLQGHSSLVWCVAISPDGKKAVSGSGDNTVRIWDVDTHNSVLFEGHSGSVQCVAFLPDGKKVVLGSNDRTVRIWDVDTHNSVLLEGHSDEVLCVAFSPDGKKMVSGLRNNTVRIWDMEKHDSVQLQGHSSSVWCVAFSPDGKKVVLGSHDSTVRIWDMNTHNSILLEGHSGLVRCVAFSPDGKKVVSGSDDNTVRIWDVDTHNSILLEGHSSWVQCVAFSPDGKKVVSGSQDNTVRIWDMEKHDSALLEGYSGLVLDVAFSPDGRKVVSGSVDNTVKIWDVEECTLVPVEQQSDLALSFTDSHRLPLESFLTTYDEKTEVLTRTGEPESIIFFVPQQYINGLLRNHQSSILGVSPTGTQISLHPSLLLDGSIWAQCQVTQTNSS